MITIKQEIQNLCVQLIENWIKDNDHTFHKWRHGGIKDNPLDGVISCTGYYNLRDGKAKDKTLIKVLNHFGIECGLYAKIENVKSRMVTVYGVEMTKKQDSYYSMFRSFYGHKLPAYNTLTDSQRRYITEHWLRNYELEWSFQDKDSFCRKISQIINHENKEQ